MSVRNPSTGRFEQKHTEYDKCRYVVVEAQHVREGMVIETPFGYLRVRDVTRAAKWVHIRVEPGGVGSAITRGTNDPVVADSEDLATALLLTDTPHKKLGLNGLIWG